MLCIPEYVTGKNRISVVIAIFGASPHPSHCTNSGASANTGIAWEITSKGNSQNRTTLDTAITIVRHSPNHAPSSSPKTTSINVTRKPLMK